MKKTKTKNRKFRVWSGQINQMVWNVTAKNEEEARQKAFRKWRREIFPDTSYVEPA